MKKGYCIERFIGVGPFLQHSGPQLNFAYVCCSRCSFSRNLDSVQSKVAVQECVLQELAIATANIQDITVVGYVAGNEPCSVFAEKVKHRLPQVSEFPLSDSIVGLIIGPGKLLISRLRSQEYCIAFTAALNPEFVPTEISSLIQSCGIARFAAANTQSIEFTS